MLNFTLFRSRPKLALGGIGTEARCGQTPRSARVAVTTTLNRDGCGGGRKEGGRERGGEGRGRREDDGELEEKPHQTLPDGVRAMVDDMLQDCGGVARVALVHFHKTVAQHTRMQAALLRTYKTKLIIQEGLSHGRRCTQVSH